MKGKLLILVLTTGISFISCSDKKDDRTTTKKIVLPPDPPAVVKVDSVSIILQQRIKDRARKTIDSLSRKFYKQKDEITGVTWFTNKRWGKYWPRWKTLISYVSDQGFTYLMSNYFSSDWVFHNKIIVKVGETLYTSGVVDRNEDSYKDGVNDGVFENISFLKNNDNGIYEAIVNSNNEKVIVRFEGDKQVSDIMLSQQDIKALKESWLLAKSIRELSY